MTDIQGYTDTSSNSSRAEIIDLIRRHGNLMEPVFTFYGGNVIKTIGDAFLVTFPSATDAVVCAIMIQLLLREYNKKHREQSKKLNLRVVINTGDVSVENNDIFGDAVNITARMEGLDCFPGGTIGISESTYLLMNRNEITAKKIGPMTMKGIPYDVTVYEVPLEEQKLTEIPTRLLDLMEAVVQGKDGEPSIKFQELLKKISPEPESKEKPDKNKNPISPEKKSEKAPISTITKRIKSFIVDLIVIFICIKVFTLFPRLLRPAKKRIFWIAIFYFTISWSFFRATLGQSINNLRVIKNNGEKIGFFTSFLRALITVVTFVTVIGLPIIFIGKKRSLSDILTSSDVVFAKE